MTLRSQPLRRRVFAWVRRSECELACATRASRNIRFKRRCAFRYSSAARAGPVRETVAHRAPPCRAQRGTTSTPRRTACSVPRFATAYPWSSVFRALRLHASDDFILQGPTGRQTKRGPCRVLSLVNTVAYTTSCSTATFLISRPTGQISAFLSGQQHYEWCRRHRHHPVKAQHAALCRRVQGGRWHGDERPPMRAPRSHGSDRG